MTDEEDRRIVPNLPDLRAAITASLVVDADGFDQILQGWIEVAHDRGIDISLVLLSISGDPRPHSEVVGAYLLGNVRQGDVVAELCDGTFAVLAHSGSVGALQVAGRLKRVLQCAVPKRVFSASVVTSTAADAGAHEVLAAASVALERAKALPYGWIEVGSTTG